PPVPKSARPRWAGAGGGDPLGDAGRMDRGQLHDAVRKPDVLCALARRGEEGLGNRVVRVLLKQMVLDLPGKLLAKPIGELHLVERVLVELEFAFRRPRARQLQLV